MRLIDRALALIGLRRIRRDVRVRMVIEPKAAHEYAAIIQAMPRHLP